MPSLAARTSALEILNEGLLPGMARVGEQFRDREIFLPDVLLAAREDGRCVGTATGVVCYGLYGGADQGIPQAAVDRLDAWCGLASMLLTGDARGGGTAGDHDDVRRGRLLEGVRHSESQDTAVGEHGSDVVADQPHLRAGELVRQPLAQPLEHRLVLEYGQAGPARGARCYNRRPSTNPP